MEEAPAITIRMANQSDIDSLTRIVEETAEEIWPEPGKTGITFAGK